MICALGATCDRPLRPDSSGHKQIQKMSGMFVLRDGAGGYVIERFQRNTVPSDMAA
jgi:hypothetical protein